MRVIVELPFEVHLAPADASSHDLIVRRGGLGSVTDPLNHGALLGEVASITTDTKKRTTVIELDVQDSDMHRASAPPAPRRPRRRTGET